MPELRDDLPPLIPRIKRLPISDRGYPVPWFVAWLDDEQKPLPRGEGTPDFRVISPGANVEALRLKKCWVCGDHLGKFVTFVVGPMCAVNRVSGEPPSHRDCAQWAAKACPFLARPHMKRREAGKPEGTVPSAGGFMIERNPGVTLAWTTKSFRVERLPNGILLRMGDPESVEWYAHGREATRAEVEEAIRTGLPSLRKVADAEGAGRELDKAVERAVPLLPAA